MFISPLKIQRKALAFQSRLRGSFQRAAVWLLLIVFALGLNACKSDYPAAAQQERPGGGGGREARQVRTERVMEMPMGQSVVVNGTLAAYDQATVGTKVAGRLQAISVDLGSPVRRGQLIARIEPTDYQLRVQQAEAGLAQARARVGLSPEGTNDRVNPEQTGTVRQARALMDEARTSRQRAVTLVEQGVIARAEYEAADAAYKVAQSRYQDAIEEIRNRQAIVSQRRSELALARQQLADTAVSASFDGVVQQKRASLGEFLAAGAPVVDIVKVNPLRFRAEVPERDAASVRTGQRLRVSVDGAAHDYAGQITRLSPTITEQNRVLVVEADISNDGALRPGSFARAEIVTDDASMGVTVPTNAIVTLAGIEKVIVVENGKAIEKPVTTGRRAAEWTEIIAGVNTGDEVVINPGNLQSG
ncbi:MAG: efflux RND transporter periplasmic adaptor subunit, partial [Acidobacteria bacterium]|nr:efflux RND transporter periplasmic adaptor subunit [Acidobacteriota bacterium]